MKVLDYKGYTGIINSLNFNTGEISGIVLLKKDVITFKATSLLGLKKAFMQSIDDYFILCNQDGVIPDEALEYKEKCEKDAIACKKTEDDLQIATNIIQNRIDEVAKEFIDLKILENDIKAKIYESIIEEIKPTLKDYDSLFQKHKEKIWNNQEEKRKEKIQENKSLINIKKL